ncbi:hypothetical protein PLESTB_000215200 [Pleodorina starrii]|uniref:Uncharacterized protein n=1 Tax=Pleodorina starrii TaxID=330485 RepID=A0A9W6BCT7_9CHLO|nr:hypothetical protein PLESTM_001540800 [Pleodorina starrii]GLC49400.1 hypothetical protein PLESTB_000215200 [Pleodorina starrii]GLC73338.1 hypothetical protein PLESTF_001364800 [Pleodorina starrii]
MAVGVRSNSPADRLMKGVRRCVRYPSSDAALVRGSTSPRQERLSKDDGDSFTILTHVQRQLVQKSFQTHAFEAKIKAKDRDDEHATTANEVLQQALRIHAASVASLHVDGLPSADDYRNRLPKRSLGRFQYEDLTRMPQALTAESPTEAFTTTAADAASDAPSPRQRSQSQLQLRQPSWRNRQTAQTHRGGGGGVSSSSPSSTATGDGNVSGSTVDGADSAAFARGELSPLRGSSWRQRRSKAAAQILRAASGGIGGAGVSLTQHNRPPPCQGSGGRGSSGAQHVFGADGGGAGAEAAPGCAPLLHRTDSALRRADRMLQALREFHGASAVAAVGGAGPALPFIQAKHRHAPGGAGAGRGSVVLGGKGGSRSGYVPRQTGQAADQDYLIGATASAAGPSSKSPGRRPPPPQQQHPYFPQQHLRSRSPYGPQVIFRSMDSIPCAAPAPPPAPAPAPPAPAPAADADADATRVPVTHDGGDFRPPVRTGSGLSFNAALWNRPSPPLPPSRESASIAAALRPTATSGDGHPGGAPPPPPPRHGRSRRASSATNDGEDLAGGGGGTAAATSLLSIPMAPATEQLFTRICRSTARPVPQQNWVPVFEAPLPAAAASSVFTAASCGASPYAARGLSAGTDGGVGPGGGSAVGCGTRPPIAPPAQRPPSAAPLQSRAASPGAVRLPPIPDTADGQHNSAAPAGAQEQRAQRRGRTRPSLSWSVAEGAATAAFVQRARQIAPPSDAATEAAAPQRPAQGELTAAAAAGPASRPHAAAGAPSASGAAGEQQQQQPESSFRRANRERSVSTDGGMLRREGAATLAAAARVELVGAAGAADRGGMGGFLRRGEARGGGGGFASPRAKPRRAGVLGGGAGFGIVGRGGGGGGGVGPGGRGGGPGGSPSIMTRMRKALGSIWPRSPGAP